MRKTLRPTLTEGSRPTTSSTRQAAFCIAIGYVRKFEASGNLTHVLDTRPSPDLPSSPVTSMLTVGPLAAYFTRKDIGFFALHSMNKSASCPEVHTHDIYAGGRLPARNNVFYFLNSLNELVFVALKTGDCRGTLISPISHWQGGYSRTHQ